MTSDFDEVIPLRGTHSQKFDMMGRFAGVEAEDGLPMWVADMDFRPPQAVLDVLQAEVARGVFGYFGDDSTVRRAVCDWMEGQHGWAMQPEWLLFSHGVVHGLGLTLEALTDPGDGVLLFTPVYHAFAKRVRAMGRRVVECELVLEDGRYVMDFDRAAMLAGEASAVIFCSPHNPGGRLWSAGEIGALARLCLEHDLWLISDEIHMDLAFPGATHRNTAVTAPEVTPKLVTLSAASKGFNVAGAETSFIAAEDGAVRDRLAAAVAAHGGTANRFGMLMMEACFTGGHGWSAELRHYLAGNFAAFRDGVNRIPGVRVMEMPATYLAWVDFSGTGMARAEFTRRVREDARIAVNLGPSFGSGGASYLRFNLATQRARVEEAVARLARAFGDLQ